MKPICKKQNKGNNEKRRLVKNKMYKKYKSKQILKIAKVETKHEIKLTYKIQTTNAEAQS